MSDPTFSNVDCHENPYEIFSYDNSCNINWIVNGFGRRDIHFQSDVLLSSIIAYEW